MPSLHVPRPPMPSEWRVRGLAAEMAWEAPTAGPPGAAGVPCTWNGESYRLVELAVMVSPSSDLVPGSWLWVAYTADSLEATPRRLTSGVSGDPDAAADARLSGPVSLMWAALARERYRESMLNAWRAVPEQRAPANRAVWSERARLMEALVGCPAEERERTQALLGSWSGPLADLEPTLMAIASKHSGR